MCALPHNEWNWKLFSNTKAFEGWQTYYTREPHHRHSQLKHSCTKQLSEVQPSLKSPFHILFIYTRWLWLYSLCPSGRNQCKPEAFCVPTTPELLKKHQSCLPHHHSLSTHQCFVRRIVDFVSLNSLYEVISIETQWRGTTATSKICFTANKV